jgi:hypothetical protein
MPLASKTNRKNVSYLNVKKGKLWLSTRKVDGEGNSTWVKSEENWLESRLVSISLVPVEFEGNTNLQLQLLFWDKKPDEYYQVGMTLESWAAQNTLALLVNPLLDFALPITFGAMGDGGDKSPTFTWIKQGKNKIEKSPDAPKQTEKRGKKTWDDFADWAEQTVPLIQEKLVGIYGEVSLVNEDIEEDETEEVKQAEDTDEIPF